MSESAERFFTSLNRRLNLVIFIDTDSRPSATEKADEEKTGELWRPSGPTWTDIDQSVASCVCRLVGALLIIHTIIARGKDRGDCFLLAVAGSIAYVDPNKIKDIMVDRKV